MVDPHLVLAADTLIRHFWEYYFVPAHEPWWKGAVWGNVFAVAPLAILGTIGYWIHKIVTKDIEEFDAKRAHDEHSKHLRAILAALDPDVESDSILDEISDRVDETTPRGIGEVLKEIRELRQSESKQP